ncbi:MAG: cytochrome c biogenesis protein CcsA [Chthonomonadetes bacterium]|nr:cytochrome c biogenesis protein CcsA [Chthonomonadetes bacterium]
MNAAEWGRLIIYLGAAASVAATVLFALSARQERWLLWARRAYALAVASAVTAFGILIALCMRSDFRVVYVANFSSSDLPWYFKLSSAWAGQEGSFLLWAFWTGVLGLLLIRRLHRYEPLTMAVYSSILALLMAILTKQSPFLLYPPSEVPPEGMGLNPLLQNYWMAIHPPVIFIGFAALGIPFAIAVAALLRKDWDGWAQIALPFVILCWLTLGAGIILGGYWAYVTLGWGGFWAWDPVENSSLVPWLVITGLMHGLIVQRTRGGLHRSNLLMALMGAPLFFYGTYMTRSGALAEASVHAFDALAKGALGLVVAMLLTYTVGGLGLWLFRLRSIPARQTAEGVLSRDLALSLGIIALVVIAGLTLIGASMPIISLLIAKQSSAVDISYYHIANAPFAYVFLLLLGLVPFLSWRKVENTDAFIQRISAPWYATLVVGLGVAITSYFMRLPTAVGVFFLMLLSVFAILSNAIMVWRLAKRSPMSLGGYLTHVGVGLLLLGSAASLFYQQKAQAVITNGMSAEMFGYRVSYVGMTHPEGEMGKDNAVRLKFEHLNGGKSFEARPVYYFDMHNPMQPRRVAEPHVHKHALYDLYIAIGSDGAGVIERMQDPGKTLPIRRGETKKMGDYTIHFKRFQIEGAMGGADMSIGAVLDVEYKGKKTELVPVAVFGKDGKPAKLPGGGEVAIFADEINANERQVILHFFGLPGQTVMPDHVLVPIEVKRKPLINLVWLGTILMLVGGGIAMRRRFAEVTVEVQEPSASPAVTGKQKGKARTRPAPGVTGGH